jgi:hypothetical protein
MQVFGFDLVAYPEHFDHLKVNGELPYPLPKKYFRPALTVCIFPGVSPCCRGAPVPRSLLPLNL